MFKQSTGSSSSTSQYNLILLLERSEAEISAQLTSFAQSEPEQARQLQSDLARLLGSMKKTNSEIEQQRFILGYPSLEAFKKGMVAWSEGEVERKARELKEKMAKFIESSRQLGITTTPAPKVEEKEDPKAQEYMQMMKQLSTKYLQLESKIQKAKKALEIIEQSIPIESDGAAFKPPAA